VTGQTDGDGPGRFSFSPLNSVFKPRMTRLNWVLSASIAATPARSEMPSSSQVAVTRRTLPTFALVECRHLTHLADARNAVYRGSTQQIGSVGDLDAGRRCSMLEQQAQALSSR